MCLAVSGEILAITDQVPTDQAPTDQVPFEGTAAGLSIAADSPRTATAATTTAAAAAADPLWRVAEVDFGGVRQQVSLACLPQARVGDRVLVHVGFALSVVEEDDEIENDEALASAR
jgi:hydrogenase expression/formation protein HypC